MVLRPTAFLARASSAAAKASGKSLAETPLFATSSATASMRTISCAGLPATFSMSCQERMALERWPVSTSSRSNPDAARNRRLTSAAPSSSRRAT